MTRLRRIFIVSLFFSMSLQVKGESRFQTNLFRFSVVQIEEKLAAFSNWHFGWTPVFHLGKSLKLVPQVGVAVGKSLPHANFLMFELSDGLRFHFTENFGLELFGGFQSWLNEVGTFGIVGVGADYKFSSPWFNAFDEIHFSYTHFRKEISQKQWKLGLGFSF